MTTGTALESVGQVQRGRGGGQVHALRFNCPWCHGAYKATLDAWAIKNAPRGLFSACILPPCGHTFVVHLDKQGNIRSIEKVDTRCVDVEPVDLRALQQRLDEAGTTESSCLNIT